MMVDFVAMAMAMAKLERLIVREEISWSDSSEEESEGKNFELLKKPFLV